ncbi:transcription antitermination factor NusB [Aegicerativicinus sediminis]|uniref:transcription antitermination factor NusB n=1 Tax=Aegicerativicinus sediminis TaxID=2893202 RepID=UPI001E4A46D8|nr:transcription antitermination factor NusB [Aegicerativicinus sediminis]
MQTIYAFGADENEDLKKYEAFLNQSFNGMFDLHVSILALLVEVQKRAESQIERTKNQILNNNKGIPSAVKLANNQLLLLLRNDAEFTELVEKRKLNFWYLDFEYVEILFKSILNSKLYASYLGEIEESFKIDRNFVADIFSEIIAPNEKLYDYFEDKKLTWLDDLPLINTSLLRLIQKAKPHSNIHHFLPELFRDEDDREFGMALLKKTVLNSSKLNNEVTNYTTNWDSERIAQMDMVLLQMAICEFQNFNSIPFKVTINEYIEIAKEYSTPKSSIFINGILDRIVKDYKESLKYVKVGRGLL